MTQKMNQIKKCTFAVAIATAVTLFAAQTVSAQTTCQPIYGGGQSCVQAGNISINKMVAKPDTEIFVDSLGMGDPFGPGKDVKFKLTVTNTGGSTLSRVTVRDIFPKFVTFVAGAGNFDTNTQTLTYTIGDLKAGESRSEAITGRIVPADQLPGDQMATCVVNQAIAAPDSQPASQDNAQLCIKKDLVTQPGQPAQPGKGGLVTQPGQPITTKGGQPVFAPQPVTTTPATGPEMLPLLGLIPSALAGFFLRRKAAK